jgi:hypothetical protein
MGHTGQPALGINVPGSGVLNGKLYIFGGGTPFSQPETTGATQVYDPVTNTMGSRANTWTGTVIRCGH